jgi:hypothetical protein
VPLATSRVFPLKSCSDDPDTTNAIRALEFWPVVSPNNKQNITGLLDEMKVQ